MDDPKCDACGAPVTTGLMAVFCPRAERCEFWPDSEEGIEFVRECRRQQEAAYGQNG